MKQGTFVTKLVMILLFAGVCAYIGIAAMKNYTNPYQTVVVYNDVIETSLSLEGWFFRDEVRLSPASGLISYRLDEGEKARAGQVAAVVYQSQEAMARQQQVQVVQAQIAQLDYALSADSPTGTHLDSQIQTAQAQIRAAASRGDYSGLTEMADQYKRLSLRRESVSSSVSESAIGMASLSLGGTLAQLQEGTQGQRSEVTVPQSGTFSVVVDGYESVFLPELLDEDITPDKLREIVEQTPQMDDGAVGKVATDSRWYLAMIVDEEDLKLFQQSSRLSVRLTALNEPTNMSISMLGYVVDGQAVVVLTSRNDLAGTVSLRSQSCAVIFRSDRGIRVPRNALRELESGEIGVYTLTGYRAEGKPVTVTAEGTDYYIVSPNPAHAEDKRILRSGDQVIIATAELYDGKVVR